MRNNMTYWLNKAYDSLLDRARRSTNQGDRMRLYQAADKILIEEAVIMPLAYGRVHFLLKTWVKVAEGWHDYMSYKYFIIEPH